MPKHHNDIEANLVKTKEEGDTDFSTKHAARRAARADVGMLKGAVHSLEKALQSVDGQRHAVEVHASGPGNIKIDAIGAGGVVAGTVVGNAIGEALIESAAAGPAAPLVALGILGGGLVATGLLVNESVDLNVKRALRRDFNGKAERNFSFPTAGGGTLQFPVTPENTDVLVEAYGAATKFVLDAKAAGKPETIKNGMPNAFFDYLETHAKNVVRSSLIIKERDISPEEIEKLKRESKHHKHDVAMEEPNSGLSRGKPQSQEKGNGIV